jgi:uncharacterized protein
MHINKETPDSNTILSYTDAQITIGTEVYTHSTIISRDQIISPWAITSVAELNEETIEPLLQQNPDIILIGHPSISVSVPIAVLSYLSKKRIGIECMSIGAACRTFNVLLNEQRKVVAGIIMT